MEAKHVNPFLQAVEHVLGQFNVKEIRKGSVSIKENMVIDKDVTAFIGLVGEIQGNISYSFSKQTAMNLASCMMMGMPVASMDEMARSAIAEVANMITGNAVSGLGQDYSGVDITPPSVVTGEDIFFVLGSVKTLTVNMETAIGSIEVNFGLET